MAGNAWEVQVAPFAARRVDIRVAHSGELDSYLDIVASHAASLKAPGLQTFCGGHYCISARFHGVSFDGVVNPVCPNAPRLTW